MQDDHGFEPLAAIEARLVARAPAAEPARSLRLRLAARQATVGEREAAVALLNAELARADRPANDAAGWVLDEAQRHKLVELQALTLT